MSIFIEDFDSKFDFGDDVEHEYRTKEKIYPAPEIIDRGDGFKIYEDENSPTVDIKGKELRVPLGDDKYSAYRRAHELCHLKHTPEKLKIERKIKKLGIPMQYVDIAEDLRMAAILNDVGIMKDYTFNDVKLDTGAFRERLKNMDMKNLTVTSMLAWPNCPTLQYLRDEVSDRSVDEIEFIQKITSTVWNMLHRHYSKKYYFKLTIDVAKYLFKMLHKHKCKDGREVLDGASKPGEMHIQDLINPTPHHNFLLRKYKAYDAGFYFRNPDRFCIDKRIFGLKRKVPGATVLIDQSGSMSLTQEDVKKIMDLAPASWIGTYAGRGSKGELRILARDGKRSTNIMIGMGGNIIDVPALYHISTLPGPRYWITDRGVTGINDQSHISITKLAKEICVDNNIISVGNVEELLKKMRKKGEI